MEVYEFEKCLLDRLEESMNVLSWKDELVPATQVRNEWAYFIELQVEPTGWQALWKIPRIICEELDIRFPTVVFGMVEHVLFKELKAVFIVQAVQDDDVHLPERHEVALEDLWPTHTQENSELNVDRTADCIDRLRFFYNFVWMPWDTDTDDDLNWVEKHLESRIRLCYDLRKHSIKRTLAAHIRTLLTEAKYIQQRREYLEMGISDDDELNETVNKSQITVLMRLHLRLAMIRAEIEILENPEMRHIYEEVNFDDEKHLKDVDNLALRENKNDSVSKSGPISYLVTQPQNLTDQMTLLNIAQQLMPRNGLMQMCPTLQNVLNICNASDYIYLSPGRHAIRFLEYLNDNGRIIGLVNLKEQIDGSNKIVIMSPDDDSILLIFDGDFILENLILDCRNVRTGILVKNGSVCLRSCHLLGDGKSSTHQGIICSEQANLTLENCVIEAFATGVIMKAGTSLNLSSTKISACKIGLDLSVNAKLKFKESLICESSRCGVYLEMLLTKSNDNYLKLQSFSDLTTHINTTPAFIECPGECNFDKCQENVYIVNQKMALVSKETIKSIFANDNRNDKLYGTSHSEEDNKMTQLSD